MSLRRSIRLFLFVLILGSGNTGLAFTILVDPGHGGEDTGAKGSYWVGKKRIRVLEKDLALEISKKIHKKLSKKYDTYLTRSVDRTVALGERAAMADKIKADLFISIHINSSRRKRSRGFEIFYLDNHNDAAIKKVEEDENTSFGSENSVIQKILIDLVIDKTVTTSKKLAYSIHRNMKRKIKRYGIRDRGIKPGLFYVLALSKRPGVLIEAGFISNPKELRKMKSAKFQNALADAVLKGVQRYQKSSR